MPKERKYSTVYSIEIIDLSLLAQAFAEQYIKQNGENSTEEKISCAM